MSGKRRCLLAALLLAVVASMGCNPLMSMWFLTQGWKEPLTPAQFPLADKSGKEVKLVVLVSSHNGAPTELVNIEQKLTESFTKALTERAKTNGEKLTVVPHIKLKQYKSSHPDWAVEEPLEVGKDLGASMVVDLQLSRLGLYDPTGGGMLYRGRADVSIHVWDARKPAGEEEVWEYEYNCQYPRARFPKEVEDFGEAKFKSAFITRLGRELAGLFTAFPSDDGTIGDPELGPLAN